MLTMASVLCLALRRPPGSLFENPATSRTQPEIYALYHAQTGEEAANVSRDDQPACSTLETGHDPLQKLLDAIEAIKVGRTIRLPMHTSET